MVEAMFDLNKSNLVSLLLPYKEKILGLKSIPKPIDDIVDAYFCKEVVKQNELASQISIIAQEEVQKNKKKQKVVKV